MKEILILEVYILRMSLRAGKGLRFIVRVQVIKHDYIGIARIAAGSHMKKGLPLV